MGYRDQMTELFTGEISGLEPEFHTAEAPLLTVRGYDRRHRLMKQRKTQSYLKMKDSDIARQVACECGPERRRSRTAASRCDYVLQHNQTDLEFLQQRARAHRLRGVRGGQERCTSGRGGSTAPRR